MQRLVLVGALLAIGAAWGLSMPLLRVADLDRPRAVRPHGRGRTSSCWRSSCRCSRLARVPLPPVRGNFRLFAVVAGFGAVLPGFFTFLTAAALPAGVRSIIIAMIPMFVLPMALAMGFERPDAAARARGAARRRRGRPPRPAAGGRHRRGRRASWCSSP